MKVTIFQNIKSTSAPFVKDVSYVLDRIKNGKSRETVDAIRFEVSKEKQNELKQTLPSICFSGTFEKRSAAGFKKHSGLVCLDFDNFENEADLLAARDTLMGDQYVFALFRSPSYKGLKLLVKIPPSKENHKLYFNALADYFGSFEEFDKVTSDISRVCYESYDPELYYNPDSLLWIDGDEPGLVGLGTDKPLIPIENANKIIQNLLTWWEKKYGSKKGERNANLFKLAVALHDFGITKPEAVNVLSQYKEADFGIKEINTIVTSAYKHNTSNFGTKFFEDHFTKRNIEKEVVNGRSFEHIQKQFPDIHNLENVTESLKQKISSDEFWTYDEKGKFQVVDHMFKKYIQSRFVYKYFPNKESDPVFIQMHENKIKIIGVKQIKDFVLKDLEARPLIGMKPFDNMAKQTKYFTEEYLSFLDTIEIDLKQDTEKEAYLYYQDKALKVTEKGVDLIDYIDLGGYVWENQIIARTFSKVDSDVSDFKKYVWLISDKSDDRCNSIRSVIGYLLHSYKTRANNKAIILNDEIISENPNGGSGKGIFAQGIGELKRVSFIDGKRFNPDKDFALQTVSPESQLVVFDDLKKNFPFESIFSLITEGITIEKKNKDAIKIPVQQSPKILISTNYTIGGVGGSYERRKFEVELSAHFGSHHTPLDEFGHMLFDDWDLEEWNRFDNFMVECLQYYLQYGLIKCDYKNLDIRKFIKDTSNEFYEWSNDGNIPLNIRINRPEKYEELVKEYPDLKKWLTQKRFSMWIESFAEYHKYEYVAGKSNGERWALIKTSPGAEVVEEIAHTEPPF